MAGNNHLLQKVTFEIGLNSQDGAFEIQNRISNAFRSGVLNQLEQLFDARIGHGKVVSIDRLEIDLGNILSAQIESDIESLLVEKMNDFLSLLNEEIKNHEGQNTSGSFGSKSINVRWSAPGKPHVETDVKVSDLQSSHYERVIRFLESGIFTGVSPAQQAERFSSLINSVLENNSEPFIQFLRRNKHRPQIFQRLALNLTDPQLMYLVSLLGCGFSAALARQVSETGALMRSHNIAVADLSNQLRISFVNEKQYLWWLLLVRFTAGSVENSAPQSRTLNKLSLLSVATDSQTKLLAEVLLLTRQLSQRSDFPGNGRANPKRGYKLSEELRKAIEFLQEQVQTANSDMVDEQISPVSETLLKKNVILSDDAGLAENTLFALPDKQITPVLKSGTAEEIPEADSGIYIDNAGLIILAPFLKPFFTKLGLLDGKEFKSEEAKWRAVHVLQHACGFPQNEGEEGWSESRLILNKLLCGIEIQEVVPEFIELTEEEIKETEDLLKSVLHHWTILSSSSVFALQSTFLQKAGRLSISGKDWDLIIERDSAVEILIDKLPWSISIIKLSWNSYSIHTQW